MTPLLGCIADDFTGATDLASNLVETGMRTVQWLGNRPRSRPDADGGDHAQDGTEVQSE